MNKPILCGLSVLMLATGGMIVHAADPDQAWAERGAELLTPFKRDLKQALLGGLEQGPAAAIDVCKLDAPAIAARLSTKGAEMGRTSHRLRNPANASPDWVRPILDAFLAGGEEPAPVAVELAGGRAGYVEPIALQPLCLTCHGSSLAPDVAARLSEAYPRDRATGFEVGDLRGVWWVTFPASPAAGGERSTTNPRRDER